MKQANSRIALLREAIALETRRALIEAKLEPLQNRLAEIARALGAGGDRPSAAPSRKAARSPGRPRKTQPAAGKVSARGELTAAILSTLKAAGRNGARVQHMADKFGVKVRNLFVWFSTTGRKFKKIKKVAPGRYRLAK